MTQHEAFAETYRQIRERFRMAFPHGAPAPSRRDRKKMSVEYLARLRASQGALCPICGDGLPPMGNICAPRLRNTFDHVWPRRPAKGARGGHIGNLLCAHYGCNTTKGNRLPTGCEIIWLDAVNSRLGLHGIRAHGRRTAG